MARMTQRTCKKCQGQFMARTADVKRGWALFCSKSCKAKKQEKTTGQYRNYLQLGHETSEAEEEWNKVGSLMESGYFGHGQE